MFNYDDIQRNIHDWQRHNFGETATWQCVLGIIEEVGEYSASNPVMRCDISVMACNNLMLDAIADAYIYMTSLCSIEGLKISDIINSTPTTRGITPQSAAMAVGTLARVVLKRSQGIRGFNDDQFYKRELVHALVGVSTCLSGWFHNLSRILETQPTNTHPYLYKNSAGKLFGLIRYVAMKVTTRDWVANPVDAHLKETP